ncbi:hypothetical protein Tco_0872289 [Tanacetum coccineum]
MFRINTFMTYRKEKHVPNKTTKASVRTKPITVSQPYVITKKDVNSDSNGLSSTGIDNTAKTRRPQPRSNTKNDRVPSASKSSCIKHKEVEVEEHHRNLLLSKNKKHLSSECNNVKLAIQNDKYKVVCAMCKQCLITANHDVCVLNYVNDMNSRGKKQKANVSYTKNQKKQKLEAKKPKKVGIKERLASPTPSEPSISRPLRVNLMVIMHVLLTLMNLLANGFQIPLLFLEGYPNLFVKLLGTVRFGNDHVATILGYGDLLWGNILITGVYSKVMKNDNVIAPEMFRINPSKTSREDKFVPINKVRASIRTNLITVSQPHAITKNHVNSDSHGLSSTGVDNTAKTKRPQPGINTKMIGSPLRLRVVIQICLWCVDSGCSKHMTSNLKLLINFVWKFLGTVCFGNDHVAVILGYGDLQWGNILITRVYFVKGLGHNLFLVGQFCDSDLEVAFRRNTCFVRNLERVNLLKGNRTTNLYTINLLEMASASLICLMAHATSTKSWLWHQCLSYLNFDTINDLAKNVSSPVFQNSNIIKNIFVPLVNKEKAKRHLTHPNLFQILSRDDYSRYTWVHFLRSKDEALEEIKTFLKKIIVLLQAPIIINDREDIGKLGAKGDIGFFIGYLATSCAYRVYNRRTKKIMETMNVTFDELSAMAFEQSSLKPGLQGMTSRQITMYDDYIDGQPSAATRTAPATQVPQVFQTSTASTTTADTAPTPTNSSSQATNIPITSPDVDELEKQ